MGRRNITQPYGGDHLINRGTLRSDEHKFPLIKQIRFLSSGRCRYKTNTGFCCVPFTYRRRRYRGCARAKNGRTWCAITPDYNRNKLWGYCRGGKKRKTTTFYFNTYTFDFLLSIVAKNISYSSLAAYDGNFNKKCGTLWLILPKLCDFLLRMFCSTHCLIYIFVLQLHQLE